MKKTRLAFLLALALALAAGLLPRTTAAAPLTCEESCQRDYQRCSARGLDSIACMSRYESCLAGC